MATMEELQSARKALREGRATSIADAVLIELASRIDSAPAYPSQAQDWGDREAVPMLQELAFRLRRATLWFAPPRGMSITAEGLLLLGFRRDDSHGHPVYCREVPDDVEGCHTELRLIPEADGFTAEIHNWQTEDGERACDVNQRVALPRKLTQYVDLRRLCGAISDRWSSAAVEVMEH